MQTSRAEGRIAKLILVLAFLSFSLADFTTLTPIFLKVFSPHTLKIESSKSDFPIFIYVCNGELLGKWASLSLFIIYLVS